MSDLVDRAHARFPLLPLEHRLDPRIGIRHVDATGTKCDRLQSLADHRRGIPKRTRRLIDDKMTPPPQGLGLPRVELPPKSRTRDPGYEFFGLFEFVAGDQGSIATAHLGYDNTFMTVMIIPILATTLQARELQHLEMPRLRRPVAIPMPSTQGLDHLHLILDRQRVHKTRTQRHRVLRLHHPKPRVHIPEA